MSTQIKTLLLVEDSKVTALLETKILKEAGYEVILAESGEKALAIIKNTPPIDLILMDINLGEGLDGTQTAQKILKDHDIPVVFLTSHAEQEMVEKVRHISRYGYVMKASGSFVCYPRSKWP